MADRGRKPGSGINSRGRVDFFRRITEICTVGQIPVTYKVVDKSIIDSKGRKTPLDKVVKKAGEKGILCLQKEGSITLARPRVAQAA